LLQQTTVSQAIATAGGPDPTLAKASDTVLYRKAPDGQRLAIPINLASLQKGNEEDVAIQEDDVIVVPMSTPRFWIDRLTQGVFRVGVNATMY
jgi:protein involved in polysaccharide export with SLBB domain